jgi:hypothetical protein
VDVHGDVQVSGGTAVFAGAAHFTDPDLLSVLDAGGDADLVGVLFVDDSALSLARGADPCRTPVVPGGARRAGLMGCDAQGDDRAVGGLSMAGDHLAGEVKAAAGLRLQE